MLNPAYSLEEQAEELLAEAESLLEVGIVPIYTRPKLETWIADVRAFRQRRLIAEAAAPRAQTPARPAPPAIS
jgi:hypothetical protein